MSRLSLYKKRPSLNPPLGNSQPGRESSIILHEIPSIKKKGLTITRQAFNLRLCTTFPHYTTSRLISARFPQLFPLQPDLIVAAVSFKGLLVITDYLFPNGRCEKAESFLRERIRLPQRQDRKLFFRTARRDLIRKNLPGRDGRMGEYGK